MLEEQSWQWTFGNSLPLLWILNHFLSIYDDGRGSDADVSCSNGTLLCHQQTTNKQKAME